MRFARHLVHYEGAVVSQIKFDHAKLTEEGSRDINVESTQKMKMSEAIGRTGHDNLDMLNQESLSEGMGGLFERVTAPEL